MYWGLVNFLRYETTDCARVIKKCAILSRTNIYSFKNATGTLRTIFS